MRVLYVQKHFPLSFLFHLFDYEIFPLALFGAFLGGDVFVWSTMATKVKVTKTMLNTLD